MARQNGSYRHTSCMNKLKQNVEIRGKGGNAALTTGDAQLDAKLKDGFNALIERARAGKENKPFKKSSESTGGTSETSAVDQTHVDLRLESAMSTDTSATEPLPESSYPTAKQQSKTQEQPTSKHADPTKQPSTTPKTIRQKKKKSPTSQVPSRIVDAGSWKCDRCTYLNERNTTEKARCEMCDHPRPKLTVQKQEVDLTIEDC
jgi:rubrerythrin